MKQVLEGEAQVLQSLQSEEVEGKVPEKREHQFRSSTERTASAEGVSGHWR